MSSKRDSEPEDQAEAPESLAPSSALRSAVRQWAKDERQTEEASLGAVERIKLALRLGLRAKELERLAGR